MTYRIRMNYLDGKREQIAGKMTGDRQPEYTCNLRCNNF
jgi:hypothetical protein